MLVGVATAEALPGARPWRWATVLLLGLVGCVQDAPKGWLARVAQFSGGVSMATTAAAPLQLAEKGAYLSLGGRVHTDRTGKAALGLRNGGQLKVDPESIVIFDSAAEKRGFLLSLQRGRVTGASLQDADELIIGVVDRKVRLSGKSAATVAYSAAGLPQIVVEYGEAMLEQPDGTQKRVLAGAILTLETGRADAAVADLARADAAGSVIEAAAVVYWLRPKGRGRVMVRAPGERKFRRVRGRRWIELEPGTEVRVAGRSRVQIAADKQGGVQLTGPASFIAQAPTANGNLTAPVKLLTGNMRLYAKGEPGAVGSTLQLGDVKLRTRIRHNTVDVMVSQGRGQASVKVVNGAVSVQGKTRQVELEAGQQALLRGSRIEGPKTAATAALKVRGGGRLRVFSNLRSPGVSLLWSRPEGVEEVLVEVSRRGSFSRPIFADRLRRSRLTIPRIDRGKTYWRVRPVAADGTLGPAIASGQLVLIRDTSHRSLKGRRPRNTIRESYKDTVVYYQNLMPRFSFQWRPIAGAKRYTLKVFREDNLTKPFVQLGSDRPRRRLRPGRLGEGTYLWYATARRGAGKLIGSSAQRRLVIRYDNATPDLQIKRPADGLKVATETIDAVGVTIRGSRVFINDAPVALDKTFRFKHTVRLRPGRNDLIFRVVDRRRGTSVYLRRVTRR